MENRTAQFTNNYYLPRKFGIDLRYCELSALVRAGRMKREKALEEVRTPKTCDPSIVEEIIKRLGLGNGEFDRLMLLPRKSYRDYQTYKRTFERLRWFFWVATKMDLVPRSFYLKFTRKYD